MLWVRVPSPTPDKTGDRGCPDSLFSFHIGASPSGKARDFDSLIRWFESSRPSQRFWCRPSAFDIWFDPIAQLAEQLPFKQWVRGSNPRRVTKKKDTTFVVSFFLGAAPFGISMLCRSKPSLRNCLVLRTCEFTAHQRRRSEDRSDISIAQILTVPSTSEQVLYRLLRLIL